MRGSCGRTGNGCRSLPGFAILGCLLFLGGCRQTYETYWAYQSIAGSDEEHLYAAGWFDVGGDDNGGFVKHLSNGKWSTVYQWGDASDQAIALWVGAQGDAVAVGDHGHVALMSDGAWTAINHSDYSFQAVWATSLNDIFALSQQDVLHYDGTDWAPMAIPPPSGRQLLSTWGTASDDVYAVGSEGMLIHYDGARWARVAIDTTFDLRDIWGSGPDDIYVVGGSLDRDEHVILHFNGTDWQIAKTGAKDCLNRVHGTAWDNIYVSGANTTVLHFDGNEWTDRSPNLGHEIADIWASENSGYYVVEVPGGDGADAYGIDPERVE